MKPRHPTPEEKQLWRESNRFTKLKKEIDPESFVLDDESEAGGTPPPGGGRLGGGQNKAPSSFTPPPLPSPSGGGLIAATRPPASRLAHLSTREANRRFKQFPIDATLDLHGTSKLEARERVQQFLLRQYQAHRRHVVIITGKGKGGEVGVLRAHLPDWLNEPPLRAVISAYATARPEKGGTGVTHVLLKRP